MKKNLLKVFIVILFLSLFTLLNWNSFSAPFERDEGEYAYSAWILRSGDLPYQNSFLQKPPLIIYTYLFGQLFSPWSVVPPRILASIFILLTAFIIYIIAKKEWGKIAGVFSVFLFLPMIGFPPLTPFAANTEKFMILPMVGLLALFVYFKESQKTWPYILAGVLGSLAVFYKPICLFVVLTIIIFWLFELYKSTKERKIFTILKKISIIVLSSLFTSFILLIPFLKILPNLFQEVFTFNISYINSFGNPFANFSNYLGKFFSYWWILLFLPFGLFF